MAKNRFKDLDPIWRDAVDSSTDDEVNRRIAEAAKARTEYENIRENDLELQEAKAKYQDLDKPYKEDIKQCNLRIRYASTILKERGKV
jgi:hypothetical protein